MALAGFKRGELRTIQRSQSIPRPTFGRAAICGRWLRIWMGAQPNISAYVLPASAAAGEQGVTRDMLFLRVICAVLAAALVSGCAATSINEPTGLKVNPSSSQPAGQQAKGETTPPDAITDKNAVRQVALNLAAVSDPESKSYKIGPRDVLDITVFQAPELSKTIQVSEAGTINFPLIGEVSAAGRTPREIEQDLHNRLGTNYLQNPQISVFVKDYFSQRVTVEGAVKKPGVYTIAGGLSLLQAIAEAQGFDDVASHTVLLFRKSGGRRSAAQYDVSNIRGGSEEDVQLEAGDVIVVPTSNLKEGFNILVKFLPLASLAYL